MALLDLGDRLAGSGVKRLEGFTTFAFMPLIVYKELNK
jgi:hypothetical protein